MAQAILPAISTSAHPKVANASTDPTPPTCADGLLLESLMSATVADRMSGDKHNPNVELIAQGAANLVSPLFGGLPATGAIANRRRRATLSDADGRPDGGATDAEGCYWSAGVSAACLNRFSATGELLAKVPRRTNGEFFNSMSTGKN